jgi:hypothetical protein
MIKPLTQKIRIIILISLLFIFLIIAPILVAYSLGYRISDIDNVFTLEKTGGIYIHSNISNTRVFLDDEFVKNNGVLLKNTLIQKLRPKEIYNIRVEKENYQSWIKNIMVYPSLVTEARVLMLPQDIIATEIFPFFDKDGLGTTTVSIKAVKINNRFIPDNLEYKKLMIAFEGEEIYQDKTKKTATSTITTKNSIATTSVSTSSKEVSKDFVALGIDDPEKLQNLIQNGNEISWLEDGNIILNWVGSKNETPYYYCLDFENCRQRIVLDWRDEIKKFDFMPNRNDVFLVWVDSGLYAVEVDDRSERNVQFVYGEKIDDFIVGSNGKIFVKKSDRIFELSF